MEKDKLSKEEVKFVKEEAHKKILAKASTFSNEYKKQVSTAIITALGLVIALVWKDVVNSILPSVTTPEFLAKYPLLASIYAACFVTLIAVIGILLFAKWSKTENK